VRERVFELIDGVTARIFRLIELFRLIEWACIP